MSTSDADFVDRTRDRACFWRSTRTATEPPQVQNFDLDTFLEDLEALASTPLRVKDILEVALGGAVRMADAKRGFIFMIKRGSPELRVDALHSYKIDDFGEGIFSFSQGIVREVVETGEWLVTLDAGEDERYSDRASIQLGNLRSVACVPLRVGGSVIGALYVDDRTRTGVFQDAEVKSLRAFATATATLLSHAVLSEELET